MIFVKERWLWAGCRLKGWVLLPLGWKKWHTTFKPLPVALQSLLQPACTGGLAAERSLFCPLPATPLTACLTPQSLPPHSQPAVLQAASAEPVSLPSSWGTLRACWLWIQSRVTSSNPSSILNVKTAFKIVKLGIYKNIFTDKPIRMHQTEPSCTCADCKFP